MTAGGAGGEERDRESCASRRPTWNERCVRNAGGQRRGIPVRGVGAVGRGQRRRWSRRALDADPGLSRRCPAPRGRRAPVSRTDATTSSSSSPEFARRRRWRLCRVGAGLRALYATPARPPTRRSPTAATSCSTSTSRARARDHQDLPGGRASAFRRAAVVRRPRSSGSGRAEPTAMRSRRLDRVLRRSRLARHQRLRLPDRQRGPRQRRTRPDGRDRCRALPDRPPRPFSLISGGLRAQRVAERSERGEEVSDRLC